MKALPSSYRAEHWDLAWVGFDIGMAATLLATSWALWNKRQAAIPGAMVSTTLLIIDSWFDVVTSTPGWDFKIAFVSAFLIELPAAFLLLRFSSKAVHGSIANAEKSWGLFLSTAKLAKNSLVLPSGNTFNDF